MSHSRHWKCQVDVTRFQGNLEEEPLELACKLKLANLPTCSNLLECECGRHFKDRQGDSALFRGNVVISEKVEKPVLTGSDSADLSF